MHHVWAPTLGAAKIGDCLIRVDFRHEFATHMLMRKSQCMSGFMPNDADKFRLSRRLSERNPDSWWADPPGYSEYRCPHKTSDHHLKCVQCAPGHRCSCSGSPRHIDQDAFCGRTRTNDSISGGLLPTRIACFSIIRLSGEQDRFRFG